MLFCHGFPGSSRLNLLCDNLKNSSISLVEINYRGDKKSEGKFSFLGSIKDIRTVASYLKEKYKMSTSSMTSGLTLRFSNKILHRYKQNCLTIGKNNLNLSSEFDSH